MLPHDAVNYLFFHCTPFQSHGEYKSVIACHSYNVLELVKNRLNIDSM